MTPDRSLLLSALAQHGRRPLSYSTLQPGIEYFVRTGLGYIAYVRHAGYTFGLGEPVCGDEARGRLLDEWLAVCGDAVFVQIEDSLARMLVERGFLANSMGIETSIAVRGFSYAGRSKRGLSGNASRAARDGVTVSEAEDGPTVRDGLRTLSREWLRTKAVADREMRFLNRPLVSEAEEHVRIFRADRSGDPQGFVLFDPVFRGGGVVGYFAQILRKRPQAHPGALHLIVREAIERFRSEGVETLHLGLSPLLHLGGEPFQHSRILRAVSDWCYRHANRLYAFQNLAFSKSQYGGGIERGRYRDPNVTMQPVYLAHRSRLPLRLLLALFRVVGVIDGIWPAVRRLLEPRRTRVLRDPPARSESPRQLQAENEPPAGETLSARKREHSPTAGTDPKS